ncbi:MAG TPA: PIG-L family deacetylase [Terriglobales bacterium]|nr:PIG-L family deacetylase [Terriglobales bacterium]
MTKIFLASFVLLFVLGVPHGVKAQTAPSLPEADSRYKVDILVIVGHPDDDVEVAAYLAKEIEVAHKRVGVVYATRGNSGGNAVGMEQANALADVREMEARHSLASYGITLAWFLHGSDTPGSDVLHSLERWGHGQALDDVVRLVRLTRPEVILTWMPNYDVGENHEDHQAAGVLATEAFDLSANWLAFPEQLEAPRDRVNISNYGEGLRPWQAKKLYYFSDATHSEFYKGHGPEYQTSDISSSRNIPYSRVAAEAWGYYKTQNDFSDAQLKEFTETPVRLIFGKSLVGGTATGDIFEAVKPGPIPYSKPRGYEPPEQKLSFDLGGPWAFYHVFWRAHGIEHLADLYSPEAQVAAGESLWVPLIIHNDTNSPKQITLRAQLPAGWSAQPSATVYPVAAHDSYPIQLTVTSPTSQKGSWQTLRWSASSEGDDLGTVTLRVNVAGNYLPQ